MMRHNTISASRQHSHVLFDDPFFESRRAHRPPRETRSLTTRANLPNTTDSGFSTQRFFGSGRLYEHHDPRATHQNAYRRFRQERVGTPQHMVGFEGLADCHEPRRKRENIQDQEPVDSCQRRGGRPKTLLEDGSPYSPTKFARSPRVDHYVEENRRAESKKRKELADIDNKIRVAVRLHEELRREKRRRIEGGSCVGGDSKELPLRHRETNDAHVNHPRDGPVAGEPPSTHDRSKIGPSGSCVKVTPVAEGSDKVHLSKYQQLVRDSVEYFEVTPTYVLGSQRKEIQPRQVGLQCKHCCHLPVHWRSKGAVYFPTRVSRIYHTVQIMARTHLLDSCDQVPKQVKEELLAERRVVERIGGGQHYWEECSRRKGLHEREGGLFFTK